MQKTVFILCLVIATLFGCNGRKMTNQLEAISQIADVNPDSALTALAKYEGEKQEWSKGDRMHFELVKMKSQNKSGVKIKSDSILHDVVTYFDGNGTPNEQMLAYYLLGRFYTNTEEAPQALQTYYDAIDKADTLDSKCDYGTLAAIYGQMATIFHQQDLPNDEINAVRHYIKYIEKLGNETESIVARSQLIRPYYLLGEKDTVLQIIQNTYQRLTELGEIKRAAGLLLPSIYIYIERNEQQKAKQMIDVTEKESGLFDNQGNIARGREHYYVTKGFYELAVNRLDSAEYNFRKAIKYGYLSDGYKGLLSIYREKQNIDSVNYFSRQYEAAQDSLHNKMQTNAIHQMSALYNYSRSQKEAEQEREKAQDRLYLLSIISFATIILLMAVIVVAWLYRKNQKEKKARIAELEETLNSARLQRNTILEELRILKEKDYESIIAIKEKQEQELTKRIEILEAENTKNKNTDAINCIDHLDNFLDSAIAQQFVKKATDKSERIKPTESEWNLLTSQFSKDIPVTYKSFGQGKPLSQLEQRICILLILDIPEKVISLMTDSYASTISNAKARANEKLYGKKDAHSLRNNLINGLKRF